MFNKWSIGSVTFLIIFAFVCFFWYQYDTADERRAATETERLIRQSEITQKSDSLVDTKKKIEQTSMEKGTTQLKKKAIKQDNNHSNVQRDTLESVKSPPSEIKKSGTDKVYVSKYGLGPFPEVPSDYDYPLEFKGAQFQTIGGELMARVRLKLWKQGIRDIKGMNYSDGRIYINRPGTVYVGVDEVVEENGDIDRSTVIMGNAISEEELKQIREGKTLPGLHVLDISEGIEPYSFLNLKR